MRARRPALLAALFLAACSPPDYSPVRDWTEAASLAADYRSPALATGMLSGAPTSAEGDSLRAMQEALSLHLSMLSLVASDGVIPYRTQPFAEQLARLAPADAAAQAPMTSLGEQLAYASRAMMQAPQLGSLIKKTDPNAQALIAAMTAAADRQANLDRGNAAALAGNAQYRAVLAQIAEGLALLAERSGTLSKGESAYYIRAAEHRLQLTDAALPRPALLLSPPPPAAAAPALPPRR
jgi:hypothetical protein